MTPGTIIAGAVWVSLIAWLVWELVRLRNSPEVQRGAEMVEWDRLTDQQRAWLRNELDPDRAPSCEVLEFPVRPTRNGNEAA